MIFNAKKDQSKILGFGLEEMKGMVDYTPSWAKRQDETHNYQPSSLGSTSDLLIDSKKNPTPPMRSPLNAGFFTETSLGGGRPLPPPDDYRPGKKRPLPAPDDDRPDNYRSDKQEI